jgi:hypothetical protein
MRATLSVVLALVVAVVSVSAERAIVFKKVDSFYLTADGEEKKRDARLELHADERVVRIADEKHGAEKAVWAEIPYDAITTVSYSRSKHARSAAGTALGVASLGVGLLVGFLAKNKKHWLTLEFAGVPEIPENYVYLRLDKNNYRQILVAVGAATGLEVEEVIED